MTGEITEIMRTRRSVRKFKTDSVSRELLKEIIDMAVTAPSASNNQPWRFFIVDDRKSINTIADTVQASINDVIGHIQAEFLDNFKRYGDYFVRFRNAPAVIIPLFREMQILSNMVSGDLSKNQMSNIQVMEFNSGVVSTSLAIQNLLLYAHYKGLGASCMTGPIIALDKIKSLLGISGTWQVACFIPIGYADETPKPQPRKSSAAVTRFVSVDNAEQEEAESLM